MLVGLVVQYLLGMAVNLFVTIPKDHPGARPAEYFGGAVQSVGWALTQAHVLLILHAGWGLLLLVNGIMLLGFARRSGARGQVIATALGFLSILAAGFNGSSYLNYDEDLSSMLMAAFLGSAVVCYGAGLFLLAGDRSPGPGDSAAAG